VLYLLLVDCPRSSQLAKRIFRDVGARGL
jgi:hypothetical protein